MKKIIAIMTIFMVGVAFLNIKDIVTNSETEKLERYSVYVSPHNVDIELKSGHGIVIGTEGIIFLPSM